MGRFMTYCRSNVAGITSSHAEPFLALAFEFRAFFSAMCQFNTVRFYKPTVYVWYWSQQF